MLIYKNMVRGARTKRIIITLAVVIIAISMVVACSRQQISGQDSFAENSALSEINDQPVILQTAVPEYIRSEIAALADIFEEEHPNIQIQLISQDEILSYEPFDGYDWSTDTYLKLVQSADVFFLTATPDAVQTGIVYDLEPLLAATDPAFQSDFYPETLDAFHWDGGLWSLPTGFSYTLLYYNKALFDAANLPYPTNDWTWNQFVTADEALTTQENVQTSQWGFWPSYDNHAPLLLSLIDSELTIQQLTSSALFTTPQFESALEIYSQFVSTSDLIPDSQTALQQIKEGHVAMWTASALQYDQFASQNSIGVVVLPVSEQHKHTTPLYVSGISMRAGMTNPDAAWAWMRFLSGQETSRSLKQQIPARVSVAEASGAWEDMPSELMVAMQTALNQSYPATIIWNEQRLDEAVAAMLGGSQTVAEVVQTFRSSENVPAQPTIEVVIEAPATAVPDLISINYVADFTQSSLIALRDIAKQFGQENPGFSVNVLSGTELDNFSDVARTGHCFEWSPALTNKDAILPLDPLIAADTFDLADYYPGLLADFQKDGSQWGIPASADIYVLKYNKELFDQVGVPYPQNGWHFDNFLETALALTSGSEDEKIYGFVAGANEFALPNYFLEPLGAHFIDESVDPPTMLLDSPDTIEAMHWLTDLSTVYEVKPVLLTGLDSFSRAQQESERLITSGKAAMWLELGSTPDYANPARSDMRIGVVSFPVGTGGSSGGYRHETGFFISANTDASQRQACWQWITYLSQRPNSVKEAPARRSVLNSEQYRQLVGSDLAAAYVVVFEQGETPTSWSRTGPKHWMWIGMNWQLFAYMNILAGEQSVEEAMTSAQAHFDAYRTCIIAREGLTNSETQRECYCEQRDSLPADIASLTCGQ